MEWVDREITNQILTYNFLFRESFRKGFVQGAGKELRRAQARVGLGFWEGFNEGLGLGFGRVGEG